MGLRAGKEKQGAMAEVGRCEEVREKDKETEKIGSERDRALLEVPCPCRVGAWGQMGGATECQVKAIGPVFRPLKRGGRSNTAS